MSETTTHSKTSMKEFTILMASLMSVVAISIDAMLPALGAIGRDLGVQNPNHVQLIIGCLFIGMAIGQLLCGPLSDAWGRKKVLYIGISFYLTGSVICYLADSFPALLVGRFIQGLGVAGPYVSTISIIRDKYSGRDMAKVMSLVMMIFIMVPAIAPSLGQAILLAASWRYIFLLYIFYSIAIGSWLYFRLDETLHPEYRIPFKFKAIAHGFKEVIKDRITISYTICIGLCFGSFIGYLNASRQIFQEQFGTGKMFTVYFGVLALLFGVSSLVNSRFVEKLGMRYICRRGTVCIIIASLIFLAVNFTTQIQLWMFLVYAAILFFCFGLLFGNLNSIAMEPMGHIAGIASSVIGSLSTAISMVLGAIIGQLYNNTLIPITLGFLILSLFSLAAMHYGDRKIQA